MVRSIEYHYSIAIDPTDIDAMGHVNNASYLRWVQAAVTSHWQHLAPAEAVAAHCWVAVRHEITYRKPAFLGDALRAEVVLERVKRESAFYETIIRRGGETLTEVRSRWCCLDVETLKPARLPDSTIACFFQDQSAGLSPVA
ncbi:thioesterase family protein [Sphingomonas sp. dw_22]|uniref:acyl-CoA thioesterase n=1 Tax=Sphingomonas sp. dw_22 TaxID=2721175 RepID=UPI001BD352E1|nr:thioesterase family protein [Sphingomonas sp. dw_22]